jgi:transposase
MKESVQYVGIDVDDKTYHVSVCDTEGMPVVDFQTGPSPELLVRSLKQKNLDPSKVKICYEASYIGLSLQRILTERGYDCKVASPSLIPTMAGSAQKTDKLDAKKLARFYAKGLLTFIYIADKEDGKSSVCHVW